MTYLFDLTWWQLVLVALGMTHITIAGVTIFLHRSQAHKAVELSEPVNHFFRFWLWLTTGMVTKEWVAVHRLHHAKCETEGDPHSPQVAGLNRVLWLGAWLYRKACANQETLDTYGKGTPDDWLERNIYTPHPGVGISLMLIIDLFLFGFAGAAIWIVQMLWIPFWAAGVINGIGHYFGYRNWNTSDASTNIIPLGLIVGGEELHNNHHAFASSARLSSRWFEFDIGWFYIRLMQALGLARVKKVAPRIRVRKDIRIVDLDTVSAVLGNRLQVFSNYAKQVVKPVAKSELCSSRRACREKYKAVRGLLADSQRLDEAARQRLHKLLEESQLLETVYQYQEKLSSLWERTAASQEARRDALQEWVVQAENAGIDVLARFARQLRGYTITST